MIEKLKKVYIKNKKLDALLEKSLNISIRDEDIVKKNLLELLIEVGEFANETKVFKYWSNKPMKKDEALEELADNIIMIFVFYNVLNMEVDSIIEDNSNNATQSFLELYELEVNLVKDLNEDNARLVLSKILHIAKLLNFTDDEVINACNYKLDKNIKCYE